jgi:hypothetical protein
VQISCREIAMARDIFEKNLGTLAVPKTYNKKFSDNHEKIFGKKERRCKIECTLEDGRCKVCGCESEDQLSLLEDS